MTDQPQQLPTPEATQAQPSTVPAEPISAGDNSDQHSEASPSLFDSAVAVESDGGDEPSTDLGSSDGDNSSEGSEGGAGITLTKEPQHTICRIQPQAGDHDGHDGPASGTLDDSAGSSSETAEETFRILEDAAANHTFWSAADPSAAEETLNDDLPTAESDHLHPSAGDSFSAPPNLGQNLFGIADDDVSFDPFADTTSASPTIDHDIFDTAEDEDFCHPFLGSNSVSSDLSQHVIGTAENQTFASSLLFGHSFEAHNDIWDHPHPGLMPEATALARELPSPTSMALKQEQPDQERTAQERTAQERTAQEPTAQEQKNLTLQHIQDELKNLNDAEQNYGQALDRFRTAISAGEARFPELQHPGVNLLREEGMKPQHDEQEQQQMSKEDKSVARCPPAGYVKITFEAAQKVVLQEKAGNQGFAANIFLAGLSLFFGALVTITTGVELVEEEMGHAWVTMDEEFAGFVRDGAWGEVEMEDVQ